MNLLMKILLMQMKKLHFNSKRARTLAKGTKTDNKSKFIKKRSCIVKAAPIFKKYISWKVNKDGGNKCHRTTIRK